MITAYDILADIAICHIISKNVKQNTPLAITKWSVKAKKWCRMNDDHNFQEDLEIIISPAGQHKW